LETKITKEKEGEKKPFAFFTFLLNLIESINENGTYIPQNEAKHHLFF
jgi:hypothetical protein